MLKPNCVFTSTPNGGEDVTKITKEALIGILCNPVYTGVEGFLQITEDDLWVRSAVKLVKEIGVEQFLVNMLFMLKKTFNSSE